MSITLCYAAAGSGKTHTLVYNYLVHALSSPNSFECMVAITFTNKAAQEMKERILKSLRDLAYGDSSTLSIMLMEAFDCDARSLQTKANKALQAILHDYDKLHIMTIDAFFQRIIHYFYDELALPPEAEIVLNQQGLLASILHTFWDTLPHYPALQQALIHFSQQRVQQGRSWDIHHDIRLLAVASLLTPRLSTNIHQKSTDIAVLNSLWQEAQAIKKTFTHRAKHLFRSIQEAGLSCQDFMWGRSGLWGFLDKARRDMNPPTLRVRQATKKLNYWLKKGHGTHFAPKIQDELQPCLESLVTYYDTYAPHYCTILALQALRYAWATTARLQDILQNDCSKHGRIPIHELPNLLQKLLDQQSLPTIYRKIGVDYRIMMVDEFQDVSTVQWQLLKPFIAYCLAHQGDVFLVGDIKQAIYGWRGGNPKLLLYQVAKDIKPHVVTKQALAYNYRSEASIVTFNNQLFGKAPSLLKEYLSQQMMDEGAGQDVLTLLNEITDTYAHSHQKMPPDAQASSGYVEVAFIRSSDTRSKNDWQIQAIARTKHTLHQLAQEGYQPAEIAILVRNHREAQSLSEAWGNPSKDTNVAIAVRHTVHDNPYISIIIEALRYIQDNQAIHALTTLIHYYQTYVLQRAAQDYWDVATNLDKIEAYLPRDFLGEITCLATMPLYSLVKKLATLFGLQEKDARAMQTLFNMVHHRVEYGHIGDFLSWWDQEGHQQTMPVDEGQQHVSIFTIHQSKGLAFQVVVMPFCAWGFDHPSQKPPILWAKTAVKPFSQLGMCPIYYGKKLLKTHFAQDFFHEKRRAYLESLNLLYVACTRARQRLYIFAPQGDQLAHVGGLLYRTLYHEAMTALAWRKTIKEHTEVWQLGHIRSNQHSLHVASHSALPITDHWADHQQWLSRLPSNHMLMGKKWHAILAHIHVKEDVLPTFDRYVAAGRLRADEAEAMVATIETWWQHSCMNDWFGGGWEVKREASILLPSGTSLRPDRVMIQGDRAVVLDFKTGKMESEHHVQVDAYVHVLQEMGYDVEGYLFYINECRIVSVGSHTP